MDQARSLSISLTCKPRYTMSPSPKNVTAIYKTTLLSSCNCSSFSYLDMQISPSVQDIAPMKREFIVARIEASQDGSPYVYVTFNDPKEYKQDRPNTNPFGSGVAAFNSIEDLMKNMPKVMANIPGLGGGLTESPTIKLSMKEYQDMSIKVGDKVYVEIQKAESSGV